LPGSNGLQGKKGVLWWEINRILAEKNTPFVLLENVDRLLKSPATQRGRDFGVMLACFASLGYAVEWRVINAAEYGGAQRRRRVFVFACKKNTEYAHRYLELNSYQLLSEKTFFAEAFPVQTIDRIKQIIMENHEDIPGISKSFVGDFENSGYMVDGIIYTAKATPSPNPAMVLRSILQKGVDKKYFLNGSMEKWEYLKGSKKIQRTSKNGHDYTFSEGAIQFPDDIEKPARTMLTSESSLNRSTHVVTDMETGELRLLTPTETERIQGFSDNWTNTGMPEKYRYFCMGNALVVPIVTKLGITLSRIFESEQDGKAWSAGFAGSSC
jgi:DNA (cytosine-5)-methyltransferase 1